MQQLKYQKNLSDKTQLELLVRPSTGTLSGVQTLESLFTKIRERVRGVSDEDWALYRPMLKVIGRTKEAVAFSTLLSERTGQGAEALAAGLEGLLGMGLSTGMLLGPDLEMEDVTALLTMWRCGRIDASSPDEIVKALPDEVAARAEIWLGRMAAARGWDGDAPPPPPAAGDGSVSATTALEGILRSHAAEAAGKEEDRLEIAFKLFRIVIRIAGGYLFPLQTMRLAGQWARMEADMEEAAPLKGGFLKRGAAHLAMWASWAAHIARDGVSSPWVATLSALSAATPEGVREGVCTLVGQIGGDAATAREYFTWNRTAGVLIGNESLDMSGAMRMLSTFTVGRSFFRVHTGRISLGEFLRELSPVPGMGAIHDLLSLFRQESEYYRRTDAILTRLNALVGDEVREGNLVYAEKCYHDLLTLKRAFTPSADLGKEAGAPVDDALVETVSVHAFSRVDRGPSGRAMREAFKRDLRERILLGREGR